MRNIYLRESGHFNQRIFCCAALPDPFLFFFGFKGGLGGCNPKINGMLRVVGTS